MNGEREAALTNHPICTELPGYGERKPATMENPS